VRSVPPAGWNVDAPLTLVVGYGIAYCDAALDLHVDLYAGHRLARAHQRSLHCLAALLRRRAARAEAKDD
jgi:hypothetical protein